jgi:hypothetical protein
VRLGLGAQQAEVGAAVRLGQAHGAGPLAAGELGQVQVLLLLGAMCMQALVGTMAQAGVHGPGLVGAVEHLVEALVHDDGQPLPAVGRVHAQRRPAAFHVLGVGGLEALGRGDGVRGLVVVAAFLVAADVQREQHLGGELAALLEHLVDGVGVDLGVARHHLQLVGHVEQLVQHELHVAQRRGVLGHGGCSFSQKRVQRRPFFLAGAADGAVA